MVVGPVLRGLIRARPFCGHLARVNLIAFRSPLSSRTMASLATALQRLSIKPHATVSHQSTTNPDTWHQALRSASGTPESYELLKVLVFKPKTPKSEKAVPLVVITRENTETSASALGKKLNLKELRLASQDLLSEFFKLDKDSCMRSL